mgnify:CR=1 FL=1
MRGHVRRPTEIEDKTMLHHFPLGFPVARAAMRIGAALAFSVAVATSATAQIKIGFQAPLTGPAATDGVW